VGQKRTGHRIDGWVVSKEPQLLDTESQLVFLLMDYNKVLVQVCVDQDWFCRSACLLLCGTCGCIRDQDVQLAVYDGGRHRAFMCRIAALTHMRARAGAGDTV
jgi:hypothetical protein